MRLIALLLCLLLCSATRADEWVEVGEYLYYYDDSADALFFVGPIPRNPVGTPAGAGVNGAGYTWGPVIYGPPSPYTPPVEGMNFSSYWNWYWYWFGWAAGE
mgnify:CR=1 FL=1